MGSRDQFDDITEPLKVEGVTTDESSVDDHLSEARKKNKEANGREYEKEKSEASIHLVVDNEPLKVPGNNLVKDSYKFIQICDTDPNPDGKPILNGHIPSKTQNDAQKDKSDIPMQGMVLMDKPDPEGGKMWKASKSQEFWCMFFMLMANLLNYMDRVTIAGVLLEIQDYYKIDNSEVGLLQTAFICSYMILSPIFGYLGDRYNRKMIMACGILFWSIVTLLGSFVPKNMFWAFLLLRALVGVGEASYSTIAPTIIADLFAKDRRTKALAVFYFAIPVGSGLGYIVGSNVAKAMGAWQWALRVTPPLGVLCVLGIIFVVKEPPRGASEGGNHLSNTAWLVDMKLLMKNKSLLLSSAGFTCVAFVAGSLSLWAPAFMQYSIRVQQDFEPEAEVALKFGIITCIAGFLGVGLGSESARRLRVKYRRADPLVCAFGLLSCAPFLFFAMVLSKYHTVTTWILIFVGETLLCLNWAIVTDIILYIVIPTRRSTASAFQILMSHAFGDAGSPYLIGVVSDAIKENHVPENAGEVAANFISLQYALYISVFVCVIGGGFFLATALFVEQDRAKADRAIKGVKADATDQPGSIGTRYVPGTAVSREGDGDESPSSDDMSYPRLPPEGAPASENHLQSVLT